MNAGWYPPEDVISRETFEKIRLDAGNHIDPEDGFCAMELVSILSRERHNSMPRSVSPVLTRYVVLVNGLLDEGPKAGVEAGGLGPD